MNLGWLAVLLSRFHLPLCNIDYWLKLGLFRLASVTSLETGFSSFKCSSGLVLVFTIFSAFLTRQLPPSSAFWLNGPPAIVQLNGAGLTVDDGEIGHVLRVHPLASSTAQINRTIGSSNLTPKTPNDRGRHLQQLWLGGAAVSSSSVRKRAGLLITSANTVGGAGNELEDDVVAMNPGVFDCRRSSKRAASGD